MARNMPSSEQVQRIFKNWDLIVPSGRLGSGICEIYLPLARTSKYSEGHRAQQVALCVSWLLKASSPAISNQILIQAVI